jgi:hypothetical protein
MSWLEKHSAAIQTASAALTALIALAALIGIKVQLDASDEIQRSQSAREAFRSHLALATGLPAFAAPADGCALLASDQEGAYVAFVDHLLYSAEQMLDVQDGWENTFMEELKPHAAYLCSADAPHAESDQMSNLLDRFRQSACTAQPACK